MARTLAMVETELATKRELPERLARLIDRYTSPSISPQHLAVIKPFLREVITASTLSGEESVRKYLTHLASLGAFALERGVALGADTVLTTDFIDEYVRCAMAQRGNDLRAERRRRLMWLASQVNPGPTSPARLTPIAYAAIKPCYTPDEMAVIRRVCLTQPTEVRSRDLSLVVGLGAGAGGDSIDLRHLRAGSHVRDQGDDGIEIEFPAPRPRLVILRRPYEPLVRHGLEGRRRGDLLLGKKEDRAAVTAQVVERAALYKVPRIEPARLRATWLADLMTDPVPLGVILQAAGLKSARSLADLADHLGPWLEHKGLAVDPSTLLREGRR